MRMCAEWRVGSFPNSAPLPPCEVTQIPVSASPPKQPHGADQLQEIAQRLCISYIYIIPGLRRLSKQKETFSSLVALGLVAEGALIQLRGRKGHKGKLRIPKCPLWNSVGGAGPAAGCLGETVVDVPQHKSQAFSSACRPQAQRLTH